MRTELEQSFADLCEKHDLSCLSVTFWPRHSGSEFGAYAHGDGLLGSHDASTLAEAIGGALAALARKRGHTLADEPLPEDAAAAEVRRRAEIAFDEQREAAE